MEKYDIHKHYTGDDQLVTEEKAAELLGCNRITVSRRIFSGDLEGLWMGYGGQRSVYLRSVLAYKKRLEEERAKHGIREPGRMLFYPRRKRSRSEPG